MILKFKLTILLICIVLVSAGCGNAGDSTPAAVTTPPVITPAEMNTPAAAPVTPTIAQATPEPAETDTPAPTEEPLAEPSATPAPEPTPAPADFPPSVKLEPFLSVPDEITYLTHAGDGSGRLFLIEKKGRVRTIENGRVLDAPFLDITDLVQSSSSEQGLLSIAFDPNYTNSGEFYINYTSRAGDGDTAIARYRVSADPNAADPASGQLILTIDQPAGNHNGGQIQFGPDGYLYIGTGDGGRAADPWDNAENLGVLLGKMLRIAVSGIPTYAIPHDNPFIGQDDARNEIWAYGLRNPWRFSFDRDSGDLYIADVGQNRWEELNVQPADSLGGEHYGWDTMEASHCFEPDSGCDAGGKVLPVAEYGHDQGCSVTGGYVYRGAHYPEWNGIYFFADFCGGRLWGMRHQQDAWQTAILLDRSVGVASFGEDEAGDIYVLDLGGDVYRLLPR